MGSIRVRREGIGNHFPTQGVAICAQACLNLDEVQRGRVLSSLLESSLEHGPTSS